MNTEKITLSAIWIDGTDGQERTGGQDGNLFYLLLLHTKNNSNHNCNNGSSVNLNIRRDNLLHIVYSVLVWGRWGGGCNFNFIELYIHVCVKLCLIWVQAFLAWFDCDDDYSDDDDDDDNINVW